MICHAVVGVRSADPEGRFRILATRTQASRDAVKAVKWWLEINTGTWRDALNPGEQAFWAVLLDEDMAPIASFDVPRDSAIPPAPHDGWATQQMIDAIPGGLK